MDTNVTESRLTIAGRSFRSRLMIGTSRYPNQQIMLDAIAASGAEIVTVAMRRVSTESGGEGLFEVLGDEYFLLPNTAGCFTARDAVLTAELGREALGTDWVKLEVIGDERTLFPDNEALLEATVVAGSSKLASMASSISSDNLRPWRSKNLIPLS